MMSEVSTGTLGKLSKQLPRHDGDADAGVQPHIKDFVADLHGQHEWRHVCLGEGHVPHVKDGGVVSDMEPGGHGTVGLR